MEAAVPAISKTPAVVGQESSVDEPILLDTGLTNPDVAEELGKFLFSMQDDGRYVGIAAFVLFALRYRLRVRAWFGDNQRDLVNEFVPWANEFITDSPLFDAVSCATSGTEGLTFHGHELMSMNHWVASVEIGKRDQVADGLVERLGEGATDTEKLFLVRGEDYS